LSDEPHLPFGLLLRRNGSRGQRLGCWQPPL